MEDWLECGGFPSRRVQSDTIVEDSNTVAQIGYSTIAE